MAVSFYFTSSSIILVVFFEIFYVGVVVTSFRSNRNEEAFER